MDMNIYRHGDLSFHPIEKLPEGLEEVKHEGKFVLAEGEFTGHKHLMTVERPKDMTLMQDKEGRFYIKLDAEAKLSHEEHKELQFTPGLYKMNVEREYDYFEQEKGRIRQVLD